MSIKFSFIFCHSLPEYIWVESIFIDFKTAFLLFIVCSRSVSTWMVNEFFWRKQNNHLLWIFCAKHLDLFSMNFTLDSALSLIPFLVFFLIIKYRFANKHLIKYSVLFETWNLIKRLIRFRNSFGNF